MACNSIAMSTAKIAQVVLSKESMREMLLSITGVDPQAISQDDDTVYASLKNGYVYIEARSKGEYVMRAELYSDGSGTQKLMSELSPKFDQALAIAQQKTVIARLGKLGKLSQIKPKDNGVSLRLEINV
jgi:hypothetical protein